MNACLAIIDRKIDRYKQRQKDRYINTYKETEIDKNEKIYTHIDKIYLFVGQ